MQITVIGAGYVGLVSGACFASFGHDVTCIDVDAGRIGMLREGTPPFFEPGLGSLLADVTAIGRLRFATDLRTAVPSADVVFIAVGTPPRPCDGHADLSHVFAAAREIAPCLSGFTVIATKSTVAIGTGDEIERIIATENPGADFAVVSNPEFLREGAALADFFNPDRIVCGAGDERAHEVMKGVYAPLSSAGVPLLFTTRRTAELIKYAANSFLALKITFINEVSDLCESLGCDIRDISRGIGLDRRIGEKFLQPGPGYGGSCFPKDTLALIKTAQDARSPMRLLETALSINDQRKRAMAHKVVTACGGSVRGKRIAVLGLTFKPDTDDMRESPSIALIQALIDRGARVCAYDPAGMENARTVLPPQVQYATDPYDAATQSDAAVAVTEWSEFRSLDLARLGARMRDRVLIDLRNMIDPQDAAASGFTYTSVGRGVTQPDSWLRAAAE